MAGTKKIEIGVVLKPTITVAKDAIIRSTHCTICGSDLHMYVGKMNSAIQTGDILGHEAIKEIESIWEYCCVLNADLTCVKAPIDVDVKRLVALADVTPTAWHGCELAEVGKGDIVGVQGCGAIGLSIQKLSLFRGAKKVYAMNKDPHRLEITRSLGAIPINVNDYAYVAEYILSIEPHGLDRGIEASGLRSESSITHTLMPKFGLEGAQGDTVTAIIKATRKCGNIALIDDFFLNTNQFSIGALMEKTITLRGGQLMAQKYFPYLLDIVVSGEYDPLFVMTHTDKFENISEAYAKFNDHQIPGGLEVCLSTEFGRSVEHST
ncbi:alcohol dehydrogenase GroES-like domain-containing protein [Aureobasidium subglaciale]|nr:alcohol dehydrogenase GroES-like domain-containing protein [Aureobasidium subglaciale]KAI5213495.1 alcohol dehydrogenase GroES-like domain-containing protein [Aureobasidium subglaciale]